MAVDYNKVRMAFEAAAQLDEEMSGTAVHDVAFHMTDWLEELEALYKVCQNPESYSAKEVEDVLIAFLVHAPNHIAAAKKLLLDECVSDIFGVGAVEIEEDLRGEKS